MNIRAITQYLDRNYPESLRAPWDTTDGFLQGEPDKPCKTICVAAELNPHAITLKPDLFILHHPPKFGKEKKVTNPYYSLLNKDANIYVLHSRIDKSGDINKAMAKSLFPSCTITKTLDDGTVVITELSPLQLNDIISMLKHQLQLPAFNIIQKQTTIRKIAIHGGEGFNQHHVEKAIQENIDLYLAGDMTHHLAEAAHFHDCTFIDIGHISEQIGMEALAERLREKFPACTITFSKTNPHWEIR
ncbi:MAG: Nif3-like dinuclear metal center hexameric protein [Nanoarchaeota archaeon]